MTEDFLQSIQKPIILSKECVYIGGESLARSIGLLHRSLETTPQRGQGFCVLKVQTRFGMRASDDSGLRCCDIPADNVLNGSLLRLQAATLLLDCLRAGFQSGDRAFEALIGDVIAGGAWSVLAGVTALVATCILATRIPHERQRSVQN